MPVVQIDGINTTIQCVRGDIARGFIVNDDLTLTKIFVARIGDTFAHAESAKAAIESCRLKLLLDSDPTERVAMFLKTAKLSYSGHELLGIHRALTGACIAGQQAFVKNQGIDLDRNYTLPEFCDITIGAFGGSVIRILKEQVGK